MIFGKKEDLYIYRNISENMAKGIDFLMNFDEASPCGKYEIDGKKVYALVVDGKTKPAEEDVYEAHIKYIDLQFIQSGEEDVGYAPISDCDVKTPYNENDDYLMVKGEGSEVRVAKGGFYIAFPCDGHRPMCSINPGNIRKVIVKIAI